MPSKDSNYLELQSGSSAMKAAGIILLCMEMVEILCAGSVNVSKDHNKFVSARENRMSAEDHLIDKWQSCVGIGLMVVGAAFLISGRKKPATF
jgi:hypothetical protein